MGGVEDEGLIAGGWDSHSGFTLSGIVAGGLHVGSGDTGVAGLDGHEWTVSWDPFDPNGSWNPLDPNGAKVHPRCEIDIIDISFERGGQSTGAGGFMVTGAADGPQDLGAYVDRGIEPIHGLVGFAGVGFSVTEDEIASVLDLLSWTGE